MSIPIARRAKNGVTLLELAVVIVIIGILATLFVGGFAAFRSRARRGECMQNLRNLYLGAEMYLQQNTHWPQIAVEGSGDEQRQQYTNGWVAALAPFGIANKTWICPELQHLLRDPDYSQPDTMRLDYVPMPFDDKPTTPHEWPKQPWFIERGDIHGSGNLLIFTDGSISDLKSILPVGGSQ